MKIAVIIHELLVQGGGERQCLELAAALTEKGHTVTILTSKHDPTCFPEICQRLNIREAGRGMFNSLQKPRFVRGYLDMVKLAAVTDERYDVWNPHHWPGQWAAVWLKKKLGGVVLWMCNDVPTFPDKSNQTGSLKAIVSAFVHRLYYWYDRRQNREVDITMLLSRYAEKEFKAVYPGPTCVVRSGADPKRFAPGGDRHEVRTSFGFSDKDFVLLWLGIFMPHRRLQDAIEAVALLASRGVPVKLLLAGSGYQFPEYFESLKAQATRLQIQHSVIFGGKIADVEIRNFYSASDAFLFPNDQQTWGLAVLEAMACGSPVLVSTGAGVHEVLTDSETAFLFPPRNPIVLAEKIEMMVRSPETRNRVATNGMELVRSTYTWSKFADQIVLVAFEALQSKNPARWETSAREVSRDGVEVN